VSRRRTPSFPIAILAAFAAVFAIGLGVLVLPRPASGASAIGSEHSIGSASAPVVVDEWADFECPACQRFALGQGRELLNTLVADGTVRFVYHHMAFLGDESVLAASASECANEQGRFWDYHDVLFSHTAGRNQGVFTRPKLEQYGGDLGLDTAAFSACVDSGRYDVWVRAQTEAGRQQGVGSTPTLFVNGSPIQSVANFDELRGLLLSASQSAATAQGSAAAS
jgi:protein-disulfide isomerase